MQHVALVAQVVSMAADNVIKVWDLRNHRCIQTIADVDWPSQEDAHPSAMMYDPARSVDRGQRGECYACKLALMTGFAQVCRSPM